MEVQMSDPNYRDPTRTNINNPQNVNDRRSVGGYGYGAPWAIVAVCIIVVLGIAFYYWGNQGTNTASDTTSMNTASTRSSASPSTQPSQATNPNTPASTPSAPAAPPANSP
jgi:uncharacterized protein HemX